MCSCVRVPNPHEGLAPGPWRGLLFISQFQDLIVTEGRNKVVTRDIDFESKSTVIPFLFELGHTSDGKAKLTVINGSERIEFTDVFTGKDLRTGEDTFYISLNPYDACLKGIYENDKMQGHWMVLDKPGYAMPFEARFGLNHRFKQKLNDEEVTNVSGHYQTVFNKDSADSFNAIGEFEQQKDKVTGTFRTESGDFRFLEGQVVGGKLFLSCFDGAHAFLFTAEIFSDSLAGKFYSGNHYQASWQGRKVMQGVLKNPDSLSFVQNDEEFHFGFETPDGKMINFQDEPYRGKLKLVQIMGSWCPNCMDEALFLKEQYSELLNDSIILVGLSFERHKEKSKAMERILQYKDKLQLPYDIAWGGPANRDSASRKIPQITHIMAYPSLLFIDRKNKIVKVHSGFDGPATTKYMEYQNQFKKNIQELKQ